MTTPVPQYKPPKELQDLLDKKQQQQANQRRRTAVLPKRSWIQRNPRLFQITFLTTSLLVFFSKPLYDAFIADPLPLKGPAVPPHKR
ncbi:hypothetical protein KR215_002914 [Drosophila sulfurigaster]|uniref:Uncharacterized protein LOC117567775 n=1 Tax=Drosophila albomicans TaxID=7291 RepID=A0A6P8WZ05_DROAB|nr:uncharacterized protein LOC117567775 [Drosophila albomicans]XP_060652080.1 uncharacterized protein LOC132788604 [Drosophila nasuta]XP_062133291.1 uncharacterized protein LOC133843663 [Drosophila sulfurigaster albostrigata]KAH8405567.1 hypothetical protein KR215_002914 [Drosophila sulfurigaster]